MCQVVAKVNRTAVRWAKRVAVVMRAVLRRARVFARSVAIVAHRLYAAAKTLWRELVKPFVLPVPKIDSRPEFLVVSEEVAGLIKPFLKHPPRNRDAIAPALAA